jgi:hypothetical protein
MGKRVAGPIVVLALLGALAAAPVGRAWAIPFPSLDPPVICSFELHDTATPGWSISPSRGTASAVGTMSCDGVVNGAHLTGGPGPFTTRYLYDSLREPAGNTCAFAGGNGSWEVHLPTVEGPNLNLTGTFSWDGTLAGTMKGDLGRRPVTLGYAAHPEPDHPDEDCVRKAASHFAMVGQGTIGFVPTV